jgi:hypothetical protein
MNLGTWGKRVIASVVGLGLSSAAGAATIQVIPSIAPNGFGSPSWTQYQQNAVDAIAAGSTSFGSGAAQYVALANGTTVNLKDVTVTGFESWMGVAAPNTPQYSGEYGNRMHFGVKIDGQGSQVSISQLAFSGNSSDPNNTLAFSYGVGQYDYGAGWVGHLKGADNTLWTNDDVLITSGANTQLVDGIAGRGSGNSLDIYSTDPGATNQDKIDNVFNVWDIQPDTEFSFTGTYTLGADVGSASFDLVPEPASLGVLSLIGGLLLRRQRRGA